MPLIKNYFLFFIRVLNKWLDSEGYLDNGKLRGWFEGMVKKSLNPSEKNSNKFRIYSKDSSSPLCEVFIFSSTQNKSSPIY